MSAWGEASSSRVSCGCGPLHPGGRSQADSVPSCCRRILVKPSPATHLELLAIQKCWNDLMNCNYVLCPNSTLISCQKSQWHCPELLNCNLLNDFFFLNASDPQSTLNKNLFKCRYNFIYAFFFFYIFFTLSLFNFSLVSYNSKRKFFKCRNMNHHPATMSL